MRRTSTIDTRWPDGFAGDIEVRARARDLRTDGDGTAHVLADVSLRLRVDAAERTITEVDGPDDHPPLDALLGISTGSGFRAAVGVAVPALATSPSPLRLLLDDLPGASLVSGYAYLAGGVELGTDPDAFRSRAGLCAGWAIEGAFMSAVGEYGRIPTPVGPPSGDWDTGDDPLAWHEIDPMAPSSTRRRRLIDVHVDGDGDARVTAVFRDSHADDERVERSFHEYAVGATLIGPDHVVAAIDVTPRVLPWRECPAAVRSADRLVGLGLDEVRTEVHQGRGSSTCTHLDDTLKSLDGVGHLLAHLAAAQR